YQVVSGQPPEPARGEGGDYRRRTRARGHHRATAVGGGPTPHPRRQSAPAEPTTRQVDVVTHATPPLPRTAHPARPQPPQIARRASPGATTTVNIPSADTPTHTAPGNSTRNGNAARARCSAASARSVTATYTGALAPTSTHIHAAGPPPRSPRWSRTTNIRN